MTDKEITAQEARQILQTADARRAEACRRAISAELARFSCILVPEIILTGNQITANVRVLPRPETVPDAPAAD